MKPRDANICVNVLECLGRCVLPRWSLSVALESGLSLRFGSPVNNFFLPVRPLGDEGNNTCSPEANVTRIRARF